MKRICHIAQSYYLRDPRVRREAEALVGAGYDVDVICLRGKGLEYRDVVDGVNVTNIPIMRRRATPFRYMIEYIGFFVCVMLMLNLRLLRGRRYDLIHVNNMPDFLVFSTLLPKLFGAKILIDVHDPMAEVFMSKYGIKRGSWIIRLINWQERISLRYCDHVLTVSDVMKERLQHSACYTPVSIVLNVPDETLFRRSAQDLSVQKSDDKFSLLYTGTMSSRYGLGVAIEAVARLRQRIPGLQLRLVGEGDDLQTLREMVERLQLQEVVTFYPPIPLSEIPALIAQSDVGISPHVNDEFMRLYFSTKVAEFVNLGLPTVVSRTETMERYFDEGVVRFCESGSVDSFAEAIYDLYADPELRASMSQRCREFGAQWNWAVEKQRYLKVVGDLLGVLDSSATEPKAKVLILVENLPVPFDRRVWAEAQSLTEAGFKVSVISPADPDDLLYEVISNVAIYRYPPPGPAIGTWGYLREFAYSMIAAFRLSLMVFKREGFDVLQACNPPDTFFLIARFYKLFYRIPFIFDHHDLSPELYGIRFGKSKRSIIYRVLLWLEKRTFNAADVVMSVNESVKSLAVGRGNVDPNRVFVVRNAPVLPRFKPVEVRDEFRCGRQYMVCYVGVMSTQDGLEYLLEAINYVVHTRQRNDITFTLIGSGDKLEGLKALAKKLAVEDYVVFTGQVMNDTLLAQYLSTADVCVAPDPLNEMNDKCSLIKIVEYMAMGKPMVVFDLTESRLSAQDAALYAVPNETDDFGNKIIELLDNPERRKRMGEIGTARVRDSLSWAHSTQHLLNAYEMALRTGKDQAC